MEPNQESIEWTGVLYQFNQIIDIYQEEDTRCRGALSQSYCRCYNGGADDAMGGVVDCHEGQKHHAAAAESSQDREEDGTGDSIIGGGEINERDKEFEFLPPCMVT